VFSSFSAAVAGQLTGLEPLSELNNTVENDCALYCLYASSLSCLSYSYEVAPGRCLLFGGSNSGATPVVMRAGWSYRARIVFDASAFLNNGAYLQYAFNSLLPRSNDVEVAVFTSADGLVWRQGQVTTDATPDFFGLSIVGGFPVLQFDLGSGPCVKRLWRDSGVWWRGAIINSHAATRFFFPLAGSSWQAH
jgi:hypothetical protein